MRLLTLSLFAFGHFKGRELDLSSSSAVHVIYGPNEAGKSTALRAITGLFYGIPHLSRDAHTHRPEELRIGGRLVSASGAEITAIRRKGRVRTLLDESGAPLPEHALGPFLGGIDEDVFRAAFGLNHESLRTGAQALVEGRGHLGESLFGAGLGGTGIVNTLEALRREADELYSPLARTRKLNVAIRAVIDAKKRALSEAMPAAAWLTQEQAIREAHETRAALDAEAHRLRTEERKLRRARTLVGLLAQLRSARAARSELGNVTLLADDAASERALAESEVEAASAQIRRAQETLARLADQRDALPIPFALLADADAIEDISTRLGSHRKATIDLPRVRAELRAQEEEAIEIARALGVWSASRGESRSLDLGTLRTELEPLRVVVAQDERIRALAREAPALMERARHAEEELSRAEAQRSASQVEASRLPPLRDTARLRRAEAHAKGLGDLAEAQEKANRAVSLLEQRALALQAALGLDAIPLREIAALKLPLEETVELFASEERGIGAERAAISARMDEARATLVRTEAQLAELSGADLPTEAELLAHRKARSEALLEARTALAGGSSASFSQVQAAAFAALDKLSDAIASADTAADRLRAQADRAARRARLFSEREAHGVVLAALKKEQEEHLLRAAAFRQRWAELWSNVPASLRSPEEMRGFLRRHEALVGLIDKLHEAQAEANAFSERARTSAAELAEALGSTLEYDPGTLPRILSDLLVSAERELRAEVDAERARLSLSAASAAQAEAERRLVEHKRALAEWQKAWSLETSSLPVTSGASPAEALRVLDTLARLFTKLDESRRTWRRVEGMERDARELSQRVEMLARSHAEDLVGRPVDVAAAALVQRFHNARADLEKRQILEEQSTSALEALREQEARVESALLRLEALMAAAGAATSAELARAECLSAEAKLLDRRIEMWSEQLRAAGDNAPEIELSREVEALGGDVDVLSQRIDEIEDRLAENARERSHIDRTIGARTEGLAKLREGTSAADAALELESAVAEARSLVMTYARARAAALVLEREIEAYKERHQGPIVVRAGELFRGLTLGSFAGLSAGFDADDEATLRCVRDSGQEVDIDGLSDGTRDQLYLALRLASLERFAKSAEPLPLILDDAFVHFDDERTRAALLALAELAPSVQVLVLTHHPRLVTIAETSLPADRRRIHLL